jgi:hypothetical protein
LAYTTRAPNVPSPAFKGSGPRRAASGFALPVSLTLCRLLAFLPHDRSCFCDPQDSGMRPDSGRMERCSPFWAPAYARAAAPVIRAMTSHKRAGRPASAAASSATRRGHAPSCWRRIRRSDSSSSWRGGQSSTRHIDWASASTHALSRSNGSVVAIPVLGEIHHIYRAAA